MGDDLNGGNGVDGVDGGTCGNSLQRVPSRQHRIGLRLTRDEIELFLDGLRTGLSVHGAATRTGRATRTFYRIREDDADFRKAWEHAIDEGSDSLEDELRRIGRERDNPSAIIYLLNGRRPEKYKQTQRVEHTGPGGGPVQHVTIDAIDAEIARLHQELRAAAAASPELTTGSG